MSNRIRGIMLSCLIISAFAWRPALAEDDIRARADRVSGQVKGKGREVVVLEGNVRIVHGKTEILGDRAVYDKEAGTLKISGLVQLSHEGVRIEADELLYHRQTKEGVFSGRVRLERAEEKDAEGRSTKDAFTLTSEELVFAAEKKSFTARGGAAMTHEEFNATAQEIAYDDEHQELILTGSPTLNHGDEVIKAGKIKISVENDRIEILQAEITFLVGEEEEETAPAGDATTPAEQPGPAGETPSGEEPEAGAGEPTNGGNMPPGP